MEPSSTLLASGALAEGLFTLVWAVEGHRRARVPAGLPPDQRAESRSRRLGPDGERVAAAHHRCRAGADQAPCQANTQSPSRSNVPTPLFTCR